MAGRRLAVLVAFVLLLGGSPAWAGITTTGPTMVPPVKGGTGLDTSASTGYLHILTGAWSVIPTIPTSDLSGSVACSQLPALTGGVTTSAGSCATTVITNANLTGPITSVGNATSIASQTGTGTKFVMDTAPTVVGGSVTALTTLSIRDASAAFNVVLRAESSPILTADRSVTLNVENASVTVTLAGNPTLADWFDQSVKTTASPRLAALGIGGAAGAANTWKVYGATSGSLVFAVPAAAGTNTITWPAGTTDFSATGVTSGVVKQTSAGAAFTVAQLAASDLSNGTTGAGAVMLAASPAATGTPTITSSNSTTQDYDGIQIFNTDSSGSVRTSATVKFTTANSVGNIHARVGVIEDSSVDDANSAVGFWTGSGTGSTPTLKVLIRASGAILPFSFTFANIAAVLFADGDTAFCSDCDPTATLAACTSVATKTGALAFRVNGANKCIG